MVSGCKKGQGVNLPMLYSVCPQYFVPALHPAAVVRPAKSKAARAIGKVESCIIAKLKDCFGFGVGDEVEGERLDEV